MSARSVVLTTLLGRHPPILPVRVLTAVGEFFGIADGTIRVAVSRMVAEGDLVHEGDRYRLSPRLVERQLRQDRARAEVTADWDGEWEMAVVTAPRRAAEARSSLRAAMAGLRLAEIREGVWLRPRNLVNDVPVLVRSQCELFGVRPDDDPVALAAQLWDLPAWAARARTLLAAMGTGAGIADRMRVASAIMRHIVADPMLPPELLPEDWPGAELRRCSSSFEQEMMDRIVALVPPPPDHVPGT